MWGYSWLPAWLWIIPAVLIVVMMAGCALMMLRGCGRMGCCGCGQQRNRGQNEPT